MEASTDHILLLGYSDLALKEYSTLVHSLDPSAVPPVTPSSLSPNILQSTPDLTSATSPPIVKGSSSPIPSPSDAISNLLIGQQGVHQLFDDFTSTLTAKAKALSQAQVRVGDLDHAVDVLKEQLAAETAIRISAQADREKALRDDGSAAKVIERYMIFTQKTHATLHLHLDNLRKRSAATQNTLRSENNDLQASSQAEVIRSERLQEAIEEMSEGFSRETAGRRREVMLRLTMLAEEEKRYRKVEVWLDRVYQMREGAEGAVIEPDLLESLLDEGIEAVAERNDEKDAGGKKRVWRGLLGRRKQFNDEKSSSREGEGSSVARILLAENMAASLAEDFQTETDRRLKLERERVDWLAREAGAGVPPQLAVSGHEEGTLVFAADELERQESLEHTEKVNDKASGHHHLSLIITGQVPLRTPSPLVDPPAAIQQLKDLFGPLTDPFVPLQATLHDLSHSLSSLRSSLPSTETRNATSPTSPRFSPTKTKFSEKRSPLLSLSPRAPASDPVLFSLLDSLHEVIEDARVDVEIALADEERVYRGFEALLGVGQSGAIQGKEVIKDAEEYVTSRLSTDAVGRLSRRVGEIELDLTTIKTELHKLEGIDAASVSDQVRRGEDLSSTTIWERIEYRTITPPSRRSFPSSPSSFLEQRSPALGFDPRRRTSNIMSSVGNVGRSFSASLVGAPKRMGSFAGGLYGRSGSGSQDIDGLRHGDQSINGSSLESTLLGLDDDDVE